MGSNRRRKSPCKSRRAVLGTVTSIACVLQFRSRPGAENRVLCVEIVGQHLISFNLTSSVSESCSREEHNHPSINVEIFLSRLQNVCSP